MLKPSRTLSRLALQAPWKIPANFNKPLLSPSPRRNAQVQKRNTTTMSPILPCYVLGVGGGGGGGFNWLVHYSIPTGNSVIMNTNF